ncbi:hypothetical protein SAMN05444716_104185 [Streptomyces harbinensis]|uniref:Uncharacterized protein n=1 Tax=Streptomyces harbinensis TaxID=1176198 RepID=A0A1I6SVZ2_9ACTN|nr:hypothetical protein SAMN05444716_104185 [Streptomyces harbinensis]
MCRACGGSADPYRAEPTVGGLLFLGGVACAVGLAGLIGLLLGLLAPPGRC